MIFKVICEKHNRWESYSLGDLVCGFATTENGEGGIFKSETWRIGVGLKDVDGDEIFNGDYLQSGSPLPMNGSGGTPAPIILNNLAYKVIYKEGAYWITRSNRKTKRRLDSKIIRLNGLKIVGNIFDNPEYAKK